MKKRIAMSILIVLSVFFYQYGRAVWYPIALNISGKRTVAEVIERYSESTEKKLSPLFKRAGISYPPEKLALITFKDSKLMQVWGANKKGGYKKITAYPVLAASGKAGPKLREGDRQVPEGIYKISGFNPNSAYHLSMKLNYPNEYDWKQAKKDGRKDPGTNIFIHGRNVSIGCLAMGDSAIEELFTLVYKTGRRNTKVVILPAALEKQKLVPPEDSPEWTAELYNNIQTNYNRITR